jgi:hypothetical protein
VSGAGSSRDSVKKATSPEAELEVRVLRTPMFMGHVHTGAKHL